MRRLNFFYSVVVAMALPLMIMAMSSAMILSLPSTYQYHFNDSQALNRIGYVIEDGEISKKLATHMLPFTGKKFQMEEKNGKFKDPIFNSKEQQVMIKVKRIVVIEWIIGIFSTLAFAGAYYSLYNRGFYEALRNRFKLGFGILSVLCVFKIIYFLGESRRNFLYNLLVGVKLRAADTIRIILGDPFYKTYLLFFFVSVVLSMGILAYIHNKLTKPERIFY